MAKGSTFCNALLKLIFNGTAIANIADNAASSPLTNLYVSLHTANPGVGGSQTTSECAYGSYARKAVARTSAGFVVSGNTVNLASILVFATATSGSETATHWAVGTAASGAGTVLYVGELAPDIPIVATVIPQLGAATTITEE